MVRILLVLLILSVISNAQKYSFADSGQTKAMIVNNYIRVTDSIASTVTFSAKNRMAKYFRGINNTKYLCFTQSNIALTPACSLKTDSIILRFAVTQTCIVNYLIIKQ
jgi:hypothetical protein